MNFFRVCDGIYRGSRPTDADIYWLKEKYDIQTIIDLEDDLEAIYHETYMSEIFYIPNFIVRQMSEITAPTVLQLRTVADNIERAVKPVFIHCLHGCDRTGYAIAAYRILKQGWSFDRAFDECKKFGHKWWFPPYWFWPRSLKKLAGEE